MFRAILATALLVPTIALAAGGGSAPEPTETTKTCTDGKVWDKKTKSCVTAATETLDDDTLYAAVRELAHDGQIIHAQNVLREMSDQTEDRVLTYWGFTHRKAGDMALGMAYYSKALEKTPTNILARSYMGQALVEQGDLVGAREQLLIIRDQGGAGTWAEASLREAITTGVSYAY